MASVKKHTGVILLAYGGPESLDDIPDYLLDIRGGRETPQHLIDEITERYRLIGGRSPLLAITRSAATQLKQQIGLPVYVGMRHWQPYIKKAVDAAVRDGVRRLVAICMAPHYSALSIGKYREKLEEAIASSKQAVELIFVESWYDQPHYLGGIADNVLQTLRFWPKSAQSRVKIIFTAHSLPQFILERGDPYDQQLRETANMLGSRLELAPERWLFSYQSAALTGVPWLGPQIEDLVAELAARGETDLLIAPIGFIADHVEVLYDIDIGVRRIAQEQGVRIERTPMLNDRQPLIDVLADLVHKNLAPLIERKPQNITS